MTGDPIKGWEAGLVWVFFQSFILMIGGFVAPCIRHVTPRAALLGTLAGVSIAFISMRPALEMFMTPVIGVVCFGDHPRRLVRRRALSARHPGRARRHRLRHAGRLGRGAARPADRAA